MTTPTADDAWWGTSDSPTAVRARALTTPAERLAWLEETREFALASGALAAELDRRHRAQDAEWYRGQHPGGEHDLDGHE